MSGNLSDKALGPVALAAGAAETRPGTLAFPFLIIPLWAEIRLLYYPYQSFISGYGSQQPSTLLLHAYYCRVPFLTSLSLCYSPAHTFEANKETDSSDDLEALMFKICPQRRSLSELHIKAFYKTKV